MIVEGTVAFSNVTKHDTYMGQSTGKYSLVLTLDDSEASKLASEGVKLKDYKGNAQRKFATRYSVNVVDALDSPWEEEIPYGSRVRLKVGLGKTHPVHGVTPYLNAVRVLEFSDGKRPEDEEF